MYDVFQIAFSPVLRWWYLPTLGEEEFHYWFLRPHEHAATLNILGSAEIRKCLSLVADVGFWPYALANSKAFCQVSQHNFSLFLSHTRRYTRLNHTP
jgi:hypothetical protein